MLPYTNQKKIPIGEQDFESLISTGKFYLDKTNKIFELLDSGSKYNFLSRPRRFGKSLMLSVIKNLFLGKKELFKGLFIEHKWFFDPSPIIYLSFASYSENWDLTEYIKSNGNVYIENHITKIKNFEHFDLGFIVEQIFKQTGKPVVVLIDEYDKPILVHLKTIDKAEQIRIFFSNFYAPIKDNDSCIRFFFLTGLTKLMKMSIFSVLNNLDDITLEETYSDLIGYTHKEVQQNFSKELSSISEKYSVEYDQFIEKMKNEYNGYNFGSNELIYNPWDINNLINFHDQFQGHPQT